MDRCSKVKLSCTFIRKIAFKDAPICSQKQESIPDERKKSFKYHEIELNISAFFVTKPLTLKKD